MLEPMIHFEVWHYLCGACSKSWDEDYEVWDVDDGHGMDFVVYLHHHAPSPTPWVDRLCSFCGSGDVRLLPVSGNERRPDQA